MKFVGAVSAAVLSFTLGVAIPAYAQEERHDRQEENKDKHEKEKKVQPEKRATQQEEKHSQEQHSQKAEPGKREEHGRVDRIPNDRFRAHFGREHRFRVSQADYSRDRRFQYGGYWFGFADPWPSNWLYTQDVYVIELNGVYYLCNANYPGVNVTLIVTL